MRDAHVNMSDVLYPNIGVRMMKAYRSDAPAHAMRFLQCHYDAYCVRVSDLTVRLYVSVAMCVICYANLVASSPREMA